MSTTEPRAEARSKPHFANYLNTLAVAAAIIFLGAIVFGFRF